MNQEERDPLAEMSAVSQSRLSRRKLLSSIGALGITGIALSSGISFAKDHDDDDDDDDDKEKGKPFPAHGAPVVAVSIAKLRALTKPDVNSIYFVTDSGREGSFYYDPADTASADNTGTILVSSSGARLKRIYDGIINVKWFGAKGDDVTDDSAAIQAAVDVAEASNGIVYFPTGIYRTNETIRVRSGISLEGDFELGDTARGANKAKGPMIRYTGTGTALLCQPVEDDEKVWMYGLRIANMRISCTGQADKGLALIRVSEGYVSDIHINGKFKVGLYATILTITNIERCVFAENQVGLQLDKTTNAAINISGCNFWDNPIAHIKIGNVTGLNIRVAGNCLWGGQKAAIRTDSPNVSLDLSNNDPRMGWFEPAAPETEGDGKFAGISHHFEYGYIEVRGALQLGKTAAMPAADAFQRGKVIRVEGQPGVEDAVYTCIKLADGTYAWKKLMLG